ncbi:MAG: radical SAM family heme chaperone HemW [Turneriella sp.]|nr:radical SAM family heme chaperone HemW [Turneriella sp.]
MKKARPRLFGIYVHLPFCDTKCAYCDFFSQPRRHVPTAFWRRYLNRLLADLSWQRERLLEDTPKAVLASVYFGGGTPSKAPDFVFRELLSEILRLFPQKIPHPEITAEANPESLGEELLSAWRRCGLNRISVGLQSLDANILHYLGRSYHVRAYQTVFQKIRNAGFTNYSADFITGVPGQKPESTQRDISFALSAGAKHISLYQLTVEPGTQLSQQIALGQKLAPDEKAQLTALRQITAWLKKQGLVQYEISNFAQRGYASIHNRIYWTFRPYLGLGVSAHAFTGRRRFYHPRSLENYLASTAPQQDLSANPRDGLIGFIRMLRPFAANQLRHFLPAEEVPLRLERALGAGLLQKCGHNLVRLTRKGVEHNDTLLWQLWQ